MAVAQTKEEWCVEGKWRDDSDSGERGREREMEGEGYGRKDRGGLCCGRERLVMEEISQKSVMGNVGALTL